MIVAAAFCPPPPLLVPEVASGAAGELADLRLACREAIAAVSAADRTVVVLGAGPVTTVYPPGSAGSLHPFGVDLTVYLGDPAPPRAAGTGTPDAHPVLPPELTVAAWLLTDAGRPYREAYGFAVGPGFAASAAAGELSRLCAERAVALLVMGDGSACRTEKAPGYLHPRAGEFDAAVERGLAGGDPAALAALDADLGAQVLAGGVAAWQAAAAVLDRRAFTAQVHYAGAPYGVGYFVASWTTPGG